MESPTILFGYLKNGWFLIFSKTWCIDSLNTTLTFCELVDPYYPAKSLIGLLLLYRSNLKSLPFWGITFSFPFPCSWSFSTFFVFVNPVYKLPYTGDRLASQGFSQVVLSRETAFKSTDSDVIKVVVPFHYTFPNICPSMLLEFLPHAWIMTTMNSEAEEP